MPPSSCTLSSIFKKLINAVFILDDGIKAVRFRGAKAGWSYSALRVPIHNVKRFALAIRADPSDVGFMFLISSAASRFLAAKKMEAAS
jgi:hypothetical protein